MTPGRSVLATLSLVALLVPGGGLAAEDAGFKPFRQLFNSARGTLKDAGGTIKRMIETPAPKPATADRAAETPHAAPQPAAVPPATVPLPRPRPASPLPTTALVRDDAQSTAVETAAILAKADDPTPAKLTDPPLALVGEPAPIPPDRRQPDLPTPVTEVDAAPADADTDVAAVVIPLPRTRAAFAPPSPRDPPTRPQLANLPPKAKLPAARSCAAQLAALGVSAVAMDPIRKGACGIAAPARVASLGGGTIRLSTRAVVNCDLAEALAGWVAQSVDPRARRDLGGGITGLRVAAAYTCRSRNNMADAKLSEHAFGNAIDISAFQINGDTWVEVGRPRTAKQSAFLRAIRKAACGPFKTVLGPGSDSYHSDHFHLDLAKRRNGSTYCR